MRRAGRLPSETGSRNATSAPHDADGPKYAPHRVAPATARSQSRRTKPVIDLFANYWTRSLVKQALTCEWVPWAEWVDQAYEMVPGPRRARTLTDPTKQWHNVRDQVLLYLDMLGLEATVTRPSDALAVDLADHYADLAGLVHVHRFSESSWTPSVPADALLGSTRSDRHALRMLVDHQLVAAGDRIPIGLRAFCGQLDAYQSDALGNSRHWSDHVRVWTTARGEPRLTVEPYTYDLEPQRLVTEIRETIDAAGLPLVVDGPYPGIWADTATLAIVRHAGGGQVLLPAIHEAPTLVREGFGTPRDPNLVGAL
jgi:hypothetical protein